MLGQLPGSQQHPYFHVQQPDTSTAVISEQLFLKYVTQNSRGVLVFVCFDDELMKMYYIYVYAMSVMSLKKKS